MASSNMTENFSLIAHLQKTLCLFKVAKLDAHIRHAYNLVLYMCAKVVLYMCVYKTTFETPVI